MRYEDGPDEAFSSSCRQQTVSRKESRMSPTHSDVLAAEPGGCHAATGCAEQACFQVRFEAFMGRRLVGHWANACAAHIGELVLDLRASARDCDLADAVVTVLAIDPAAELRIAAGGEPGPLWPGFAFSAFPVAAAPGR
jgi:hypothetical protein